MVVHYTAVILLIAIFGTGAADFDKTLQTGNLILVLNRTTTTALKFETYTWDNDNYIWINRTTNGSYQPGWQKPKPLFIIKIVFFVCIGIGFVCSLAYACVTGLKRITSNEDSGQETRVHFENGVVNFSYEGEGSEPNVQDDNPPDYFTVMAQDDYGVGSNQLRPKNSFLARICRKKNNKPANQDPKDEMPPSYASVSEPKI